LGKLVIGLCSVVRQPLPAALLCVLGVLVLLSCTAAPGVSRTPSDSPHGRTAGASPKPGLSHGEVEQTRSTVALDLRAIQGLDGITAALASKRVVFVGEVHDRYDHHLNQLDILKGLHARNPDTAIGVEWFQQPYQQSLDAYIAGEIDEATLLERTEYYSRWRYDFRLYRPILEYARAEGIPVVALNVPSELTRKVGRLGLDTLSAEERAQLPGEIDRSDSDYRERLRQVYGQHPGGERNFERFETVQLLWDEGMAERASRYLQENPGRNLVVLAGSGHLSYGSGIPRRVARRLPIDYAIVLSDAGGIPDPQVADYLLMSTERRLPPSGKLGALLDDEDGTVRITRLAGDSAASVAGLRENDRIVAISGNPVSRFADVKVLLLDSKPGDTVTVEYQRNGWLGGNNDGAVDVVLR